MAGHTRSKKNTEIFRIRLKTGMTQEQFASFYEINLRTLQGWESGRPCPTYVTSNLDRLTDYDIASGRLDKFVLIDIQ